MFSLIYQFSKKNIYIYEDLDTKSNKTLAVKTDARRYNSIKKLWYSGLIARVAREKVHEAKQSEYSRRTSALYHNLNNFFLSLLLLIRCILSLSQAFLNNTELKIFGRIIVRIHLMSKRRLRKKL